METEKPAEKYTNTCFICLFAEMVGQLINSQGCLLIKKGPESCAVFFPFAESFSTCVHRYILTKIDKRFGSAMIVL